MERIIKRSLLVYAFISGLFLFSVKSAPSEGAGFYFNVDAGAALVQDMGGVFDISGAAVPDVTFNPGPRLSLGGGYNFCEWFGAGVALAAMVNEADFSLSDVNYYFIQAPILANFEFRWPNKSRFVPMIGGGPGGAFRVLTLADDPRIGGAGDFFSHEFTFAWQFYGGVRYRISDKCSLGLVYSYLDMPATFRALMQGSSSPQKAVVRFEGNQTHSFSLRFQMDF